MLDVKKTLLISALALALAACGSGTENSNSSTSPTASTSSSPSPESTSNVNSSATPNIKSEQFAQQIELMQTIKSGKAGETIKVPVMVKNTSNFVWDNVSSNPTTPVNFSYNWFNSSGKRVVYNGNRTPLPTSLPPQQSEQLNAVIKFPEQPGKYTLVLTMVQEGVTWFNDAGARSPKIPVTVTAK